MTMPLWLRALTALLRRHPLPETGDAENSQTYTVETVVVVHTPAPRN